MNEKVFCKRCGKECKHSVYISEIDKNLICFDCWSNEQPKALMKRIKELEEENAKLQEQLKNTGNQFYVDLSKALVMPECNLQTYIFYNNKFIECKIIVAFKQLFLILIENEYMWASSKDIIYGIEGLNKTRREYEKENIQN